MTKKQQAAAPAETAPLAEADVHASAPENADTIVAPDTDPDPARIEPPSSEPVRGRALIDLPAHGLKCGEYGALPAAVAPAMIEAGAFDPQAAEA